VSSWPYKGATMKIVIRNTTDRLAWNWEEEYNARTLVRAVSILCIEIEDSDNGLFLTCPSHVSKDAVAVEVTAMMNTADTGVPMLVCLEDELIGRRLTFYFLNSLDAMKYVAERNIVQSAFNLSGPPTYQEMPDMDE
jgi:hypothetical protein